MNVTAEKEVQISEILKDQSPKQRTITLNELIANTTSQKERDILFQEREFANLQRRAQVFAESDVVPDRFKGKLANCMIAINMADRLGVGELEIMQNLYVVYGNPGFSAQYLIARVNSSGIIQGRLKFKYVGEKGTPSYGCVAYARERDTGDALEGSTVDLALAKAEGWWDKKGSKWPTMTDQMLIYRAAAFWARAYAGDAIFGLQTAEELSDVGASKNSGQINENYSVSHLTEVLKGQAKAAKPDQESEPKEESKASEPDTMDDFDREPAEAEQKAKAKDYAAAKDGE